MDCPIVEETVEAAGLTLRMRRIADLDRLIREAEEEDDLPFWAELWPSALGLIEALAREDIRGKRVLELGCGLGTGGIGAALLGAEVTFSDFHPQALAMAEENARLNGVAGTFVRADWRAFPGLGSFDWVIGSDLLYEPKTHGDLLKVAEASLAPGGAAVFTDPGRAWAADFVRLFEERGWRVERKKRGKIDVYLCRRHRPCPLPMV